MVSAIAAKGARHGDGTATPGTTARRWPGGDPRGRIGRDEDMAGAAIYLASRAGDYVVGETIAVDGGVALANTIGGV